MRPQAVHFLSAAKKNAWIANRFYTFTRPFAVSSANTKFGHTPRHFARMSSGDQQTATIPAEGEHTATVIFLHGLGDNGGSWVPPFQLIRIPYIKYVFPTASTQSAVLLSSPIIAVTWQNGMEMPAWFNVKNLSFYQYDEDERGIRNAVKKIHAMLQEEIKTGIPSDRIILGGFSQGGGLALHSGLTFDQPLAALVGLSCRLPLPKRITSERRININIPLLHCHGDADLVTPIDMAYRIQNTIKGFNKNPTFKVYPKMIHSTCAQEMKDVKEFMVKHLPPK